MLFFNRTVDGVIADISRKIDLLDKIAKRKLDDAFELQVEADALRDRADEAMKESGRAKRLGRKFIDLVS